MKLYTRLLCQCLLILICTDLCQAQTVSSRRRTGSGAGSRTVVTIDQCVSGGCPCCIFMSQERGTLCKTDGGNSERTEQLWGARRNFTVRGRTFTLFNGNESQSDRIAEIIGVLPDAYLEAVPDYFRIGNPRNGNKNVPEADTSTIGGGSRRCYVRNPEYDYIIIHPAVFTNPDENPALTILHEAGHFIDKYHNISGRLVSSHSEQFGTYLRTYRGDTRGNDEVIAQGIMYYFYRKYLRRNRRGELMPFSTTGRAGRFPTWLSDLIEADIQRRS